MALDGETDMPGDTSVDELDLTDSELLELIENHGIDRRSLMKVLGAGSLLSLGVGSAAATHDQPHPPHIDSHFGYTAPADERLPGKLRPDHTVKLHAGPSPIPFHFDPMGIHVDVGDIVRFDFESADHTVTAYHPGHGRQQRVPDDEVPFSSPMVNAGGFWLYQFDHPGTYDMYCGPHQFFGMVMRIVVGDPDADDYDGEFGDQGRPPESRAALTELLRIASGDDTVSWQLPASADIFATAAMSVDNIVENGPVDRGVVVADL